MCASCYAEVRVSYEVNRRVNRILNALVQEKFNGYGGDTAGEAHDLHSKCWERLHEIHKELYGGRIAEEKATLERIQASVSRRRAS